MNAFKGLSDDKVSALKIGTFSSPVTRGSGTIFLASKNNLLETSLLVKHGSVIDSHLLTGREMHGSRTNFLN